MRRSLMHLIILTSMVVVSCREATKNREDDSTTVEKVPTEAIDKNFSFEGNNKSRLTEQLFFHLRQEVIDVDENTFVLSEELKLDKMNFFYQIVMVDKEMLRPLYSGNSSRAKVTLASYQQTYPDYLLGDSIRIEGVFKIGEVDYVGPEKRPMSVSLVLEANTFSSYFSPAYYSYGSTDRVHETDVILQNLIVMLNEPIIFNRSNLYLKARMVELTAEDLSGMTKEQLTFFRNEIFARHGHQFKTDRMNNYFLKQEWYQPYFYDATKHLNDFERKNALFIKSLES